MTAQATSRRSRRFAFFLPSLAAGGAERMTINLLRGMAERATHDDLALDLVLGQATGPFLAHVPSSVRVIDLGAGRMRKAVFVLARYLRSERPTALLSRMNHANLAAIAARTLARVDTRVVVTEASHLSAQAAAGGVHRLVHPLVRRLYPRANRIIAVSQGVGRELIDNFGLPPEKVQVIYNPVVDVELIRRAAEPPEHPWLLTPGPPLLLAVGRLAPAKDFITLLNAVALVRREYPIRLVILGEGPERARLELRRRELHLDADVALPGFAANPYAAMRFAQALVLSSCFEGLPNALIEAMACGCPVVATDCESGPSEILAGGRFGKLSPVGDAAALARAILETLDTPIDRDSLRRRAAEFSVAAAVPQYLAALDPTIEITAARRAA